MSFAQLILSDGTRFTGRAFGEVHEAVGEVVFSTGMVGYQEVISDPAYAGQIVVMTYPLIGNYGAMLEDMESDRPLLSALVVRERCGYPNNFRTEMDFDGFMKQHGIMGLEGIDTRLLTRRIRDDGIMQGIITTLNLTDEQALAKMNVGANRVRPHNMMTNRAGERGSPLQIDGKGKHIAFVDMGTTQSVLTYLKSKGHKLTVLPSDATAAEIGELSPDAVFISGGPGDPHEFEGMAAAVKSLADDYPICGVGLGHLIIALALGCKVERLKFGHHGANYPVKSAKTGRVHITNQNHNWNVTDVPAGVSVTYTNINDKTVEGIAMGQVQSVQFIPKTGEDDLELGIVFRDVLK